MYGWVLGVLGLAPAVHAEPATPEVFTSTFVTALHQSAPTLEIRVSAPMELRLKTDKGEGSTMFLNNAYQEYLADPSAMDEIIGRFVASFAGVGESSLVPGNIVPVIKDRAWLAEMRQALSKADGEPATQVWEDFNAELVIVYAEDTPRNTRYFSSTELDKIGLKRDNLRTLAIANLQRILPEVQIHKGPHVSMLTAGGDYVASLLVIDELWSKGNLPVEGEIVVAVPSRDVVLLTGSKDPEGVQQLRRLAREAMTTNTYRLTDTLFVYRGGKFVVFEP